MLPNGQCDMDIRISYYYYNNAYPVSVTCFLVLDANRLHLSMLPSVVYTLFPFLLYGCFSLVLLHLVPALQYCTSTVYALTCASLQYYLLPLSHIPHTPHFGFWTFS